MEENHEYIQYVMYTLLDTHMFSLKTREGKNAKLFNILH